MRGRTGTVGSHDLSLATRGRAPHFLAVAAAFGAVVLPAQSTRAQPEAPEDTASAEEEAPTPTPPQPWNAGVTEAQKEAAQPFFDAGNGHFERSSYGNALKEYRRAIEHRDHPAIRYNMAVCLINLDQPILAYEELGKAMKYGAAPLGEELHKEGQTYLKLLLGQLAELVVSTETAGAKVSLDGKELFVGPGKATRLVRPTRHQIIATKAQMLTITEDVVPAAGEKNEVALRMVPLRESVVMRRRWASWKPWAIAGAGAGIALLGLPMRSSSIDNASNFDAQVVRTCPAGCDELPDDLVTLRDRAKSQQTIAFSMFVAGGALLTTGVVAAFLNRPQATEMDTPQLSIAPASEGQGFSASLSGRF